MDVGSAFLGWMGGHVKVHWENSQKKKKETKWKISKSVISASLCVTQPTNIVRCSEDVLPD